MVGTVAVGAAVTGGAGAAATDLPGSAGMLGVAGGTAVVRADLSVIAVKGVATIRATQAGATATQAAGASDAARSSGAASSQRALTIDAAMPSAGTSAIAVTATGAGDAGFALALVAAHVWRAAYQTSSALSGGGVAA